MSKTLKTILVGMYFAIFLYSLKYLLFYKNEEVIELNYLLRSPGLMRKIRRDIKRKTNTTTLSTEFKETTRLPTDLRFILIWNHVYYHPSQVFMEGQKAFLNNNCSYFNCYLTSNKGLLVDIRYFDAILFDEESHWDEHPPLRSPKQKYIFTATESASLYPVCNPKYDNYYNLTWTYKLDSDICRSPVRIFDKSGCEVGPKINMTWVAPMQYVSEEVRKIIKGKRKAVAWIETSCVSRNTKMQGVVRTLNDSLVRHKLSLDVYGWCGNMNCPRDRIEDFLALLRKSYYFYLVFEYSAGDDYVSEKILYPLQNYAVPIVYGGADYSRFLPPGSYIDAGKLESNDIVSLMVKAMNNFHIYSGYFRWRNHYTYKEAPRDAGICTLCKLLNESSGNFSVIRLFRKWWNHNHDQDCKNNSKLANPSIKM